MQLKRRQILGLSALFVSGMAWRIAGHGATTADLRSPLQADPDDPPGNSPLKDQNQRLVLISDLNGPYGSTSYIDPVHRGIALIPSLQAGLVLCAGDMVAGQKRGLGRQQLAAMWNGFDRDVLTPLRDKGLAFAPAMGNHDASSARSGGDFAFANDRAEAARFWRQRQDDLGLDLLDSSAFPFHYAFRRGDVFVLVWDASSATVPASQLAWADRLLDSPAARRARHRLVMGHLPLRAVGQGRDRAGEVLASADAIQALLERRGVEAYVSGHHHAWYPGRIGTLDLIQLGALGSGPRRLIDQNRTGFQSLTVLDFSSTGQRRETTLDLRSRQVVPPLQLPARLEGKTGRVVRRNPTPAELSL